MCFPVPECCLGLGLPERYLDARFTADQIRSIHNQKHPLPNILLFSHFQYFESLVLSHFAIFTKQSGSFFPSLSSNPVALRVFTEPVFIRPRRRWRRPGAGTGTCRPCRATTPTSPPCPADSRPPSPCVWGGGEPQPHRATAHTCTTPHLHTLPDIFALFLSSPRAQESGGRLPVVGWIPSEGGCRGRRTFHRRPLDRLVWQAVQTKTLLSGRRSHPWGV